MADFQDGLRPVMYDRDDSTLKYLDNGVQTVPSTGGSSYLSSTVTLTDAQIKALPTTPSDDIIPVPGANKLLVPVMAVISSNIVADYTNISATYCEIGITYNGGAYMLQPLIDTSAPSTTNQLTNLLTGAGCIYRIAMSDNSIVNDAVVEGAVSLGQANSAIRLEGYSDDGNFTGGNAANTLKVTVYYVVVDL